jgi:hypothetical protein
VTEHEVQAGQAYGIEPGHDAWVVGNEPAVGFEFDARTVEEHAQGRRNRVVAAPDPFCAADSPRWSRSAEPVVAPSLGRETRKPKRRFIGFRASILSLIIS